MTIFFSVFFQLLPLPQPLPAFLVVSCCSNYCGRRHQNQRFDIYLDVLIFRDDCFQLFKWFQLFFSSPCRRQCELLLSLDVRRLLTFHILISSETHQPNELKLGQCAKLFWTASPRPVEIAAVQSIPVVIDRCVQSKKRLQSCIDYILF